MGASPVDSSPPRYPEMRYLDPARPPCLYRAGFLIITVRYLDHSPFVPTFFNVPSHSAGFGDVMRFSADSFPDEQSPLIVPRFFSVLAVSHVKFF